MTDERDFFSANWRIRMTTTPPHGGGVSHLTFGPIVINLYKEIYMAGVPVKHHSKGKVGRRRSHLALRKIDLAVCPSCRGPKLPHRTCSQCDQKR